MVGKQNKLLQKILSGAADANIDFEDLRKLLLSRGFSERVRGSHYVFYRQDVEEIINLQRAGSKAKVYQVRQARTVLLKYGITSE